MAFHHSQRIVSDGLVFCMDPANTKGYVSGSTTGTDLIQDASYTLVNAVDYQSNNGGVWNFGGTDDYIDVVNPTVGFPSGDNQRSLCAWVLSTNTSTRQSVFGYGVNASYQSCDLEVGTPYTGTQNNMCLHIWNAGYSTTTDTFTANEWHYCVITYAGGTANATNVKLYIDAVDSGFVVEFGGSVTLNTTSNNARLGMRAQGSYTDLDLLGQVGPVQIYNRVLTPAEVLQNYNAMKGRFE